MQNETNEKSDTWQSWVRIIDLYSEILQTPAGGFYLPLVNLIRRLMTTWLPSQFIAGQSHARFYFTLSHPDTASYTLGKYVLIQLASDGTFDCRRYNEKDVFENPTEQRVGDIDDAQEASLAFAESLIRPQG